MRIANAAKPVQRVWITGASSGLGAALARAYDAKGAQTYLTARSSSKLESALSTFQSGGKIFPCDVTDDLALSNTVERIYADAERIDIAILNAGTYAHCGLDDIKVDDARALFALNFFSIVHCIELLTPRMATSGGGKIVVIGSVAGDIGLPYAAIYSASKSALNRLCESLHPELGRKGISISIVNPGFVKTPLTDKNTFPMPFRISAEQAAETIINRLAKNQFEIRFPFLMSIIMRRFARLPKRLLLSISKKMLSDD